MSPSTAKSGSEKAMNQNMDYDNIKTTEGSRFSPGVTKIDLLDFATLEIISGPGKDPPQTHTHSENMTQLHLKNMSRVVNVHAIVTRIVENDLHPRVPSIRTSSPVRGIPTSNGFPSHDERSPITKRVFQIQNEFLMT